jgi:release factor glutamine methyltransferase
MFVKDNSIRSVKAYMNDRLEDLFSFGEIKIIISYAIEKRLQIPQNQQIAIDNETVSESDLLYFRSVVKRLQAQEPLAYVIGFTDFDGLNILCDSSALIPRPETVELVDLIHSKIQHINEPTIIDLCTGTGCIAFAIENRIKNAKISATEFSESALQLAELNKLNLHSKVHFLQKNALLKSDFDFIEDESLDVVISNPPYITENERDEMFENVLKHEPHMALFVTNGEPLQFYESISMYVFPKLKINGWIAFELNENFAPETAMMLKELNYSTIQIHKDLQGKNRILTAQKI